MLAHLTKTEYEMLAAFRYHLRQFLKFSEEAAQSAGLTLRQHQALLAIKGFPNRETVTIGELAAEARMNCGKPSEQVRLRKPVRRETPGRIRE
jgi:hypothetical protein